MLPYGILLASNMVGPSYWSPAGSTMAAGRNGRSGLHLGKGSQGRPQTKSQEPTLAHEVEEEGSVGMN